MRVGTQNWHFGTVILTACLATGSAVAQLTPDCTVSVLNRTVQVNPDGSWVLPNVPADFGQVKARATCLRSGTTEFGESDYFTVPANGAVNLPTIALGAVTPIPVSLAITPASPLLNSLGQTIQLAVEAGYPNGSVKSVAAANTGTNYTSSNPAIATISADGLLTAVSSGTVVVQASNDGASGIISARVVLSGADSDGDGIPDDVEGQLGLNPNDPVDAQEDFDRDNLTNLQEFLLGTDIRKADTDEDGLSDGDESLIHQTNPLVPDTDGDGVPDGIEVQTGTNPLDPNSFDLSRALLSLAVTPASFALTVNAIFPEVSQQLSVIGTLIDQKTTLDLTASQRGTNYSSSDLSVCSFGGSDGRVFAGVDGTCVITVSNNGFTAIANGTVTSFGPTALSFLSIPGYANNVDVSGNFAYVAAGSAGLQVVDVSDRSNPQIAAALALPGNANDIRVLSDMAYVAAGSGGLQIIDVSNPLSPQLLGALPGGDAWDVVVRDSTAYVANGSGGLLIVDVANPASPQVIGSLVTPGTARGVDVDSTRSLGVIAAGTAGIHVVSILNPASPSLVSTLSGGDVRDLALVGNFAFLADFSRSFTSVDLNNPATPVLRASTSSTLGGLLLDVATVGSFAFGADVFFVNGVPIIDVSVPASPQPRAILNFGNFRDDNGTGIAADPSFVYLTASTGIQENGVSGDTRLYIGQYQQIVDTGGVAPNIEITSPTQGPLIEGDTILFSANATDDVAVASVSLLADGQVVFTSSSEPFALNYTVPLGKAILTFGATATDYGANVGTAAPVQLAVIPDPLTTATGRIVDDQGVPVPGASVSSFGVSGSTAADGTFSLPGLPTVKGPIVVSGFATVNGTLLNGKSVAVAPVVGGTTNVGDIQILPKPLITGISPRFVFPGQVADPVVVTGANLVGATFLVNPETTPPAITVAPNSVDPSGNSAELALTVAASASGSFVLVATSSVGSSDPNPSVANAIHVLVAEGDEDDDGLRNDHEVQIGTDPLVSDTDEDGFQDGVEVASGSDPLDANSSPNTGPASGQITGTLVSILNVHAPESAPAEADSIVFGVQNDAVAALSELSRLLTDEPAVGLTDGDSSGNASTREGSSADADGDGLTDLDELTRRTNPNYADSDGDGYGDGLEVRLGTNPLDFSSVPKLYKSGEAQGTVFTLQNLAKSPIRASDEAGSKEGEKDDDAGTKQKRSSNSTQSRGACVGTERCGGSL